MIIAVSIVDKHKPQGHSHVGTYLFEIDYPGDSHFDFLTVACPVEDEQETRNGGLNHLHSREDMERIYGGVMHISRPPNKL